MLSRSNLQGSTFEAQHGFIMEYYLIVIQHCMCETQNNKTQVPCCLLPLGWGSRGTGFIMEYGLGAGDSSFPGSWLQFITRRFLEGAVLEVANHCRYT